MLAIMLLFVVFALTTAGGVVLARTGDNSVRVNTSAVGVLACVLTVFVATAVVASTGALTGL